ncbi:MAG: regulatory iron-sulfur-containing complex subunit RicT [Patescibacteria group bacterium]
MRFVRLKIYPWAENTVSYPEFELAVGERVLVKIENGQELGQVTGFFESNEGTGQTAEKIIRQASEEECRQAQEFSRKKIEAESYCRDMIKKQNLPMKLIDTHFSFDGGRLTFAFVADGRVDFRDLVKDLTRHFQKSIRLQQIGMRDEARREGGFGACGRELCCIKFMKKLGNVTTDLARDQQVAHRGSERLSGACGRLLCCLSFEEAYYKELKAKFPPMESLVKTKKGRGKVVAWNIVKESYRVRFEDGNETEISLEKK